MPLAVLVVTTGVLSWWAVAASSTCPRPDVPVFLPNFEPPSDSVSGPHGTGVGPDGTIYGPDRGLNPNGAVVISPDPKVQSKPLVIIRRAPGPG